jgi:hypothetical protein
VVELYGGDPSVLRVQNAPPRSLPGMTPKQRLPHMDDIRYLCVSGDVSTVLRWLLRSLVIISNYGQQPLVRFSLAAFDDPPCFDCEPCHYLCSSLCISPWHKVPPSPKGLLILVNALRLQNKRCMFKSECKQTFGQCNSVFLPTP